MHAAKTNTTTTVGMTRRAALCGFAMGICGTAATGRAALAAAAEGRTPPTTHNQPSPLERLPNGVEIWQVTTEEYAQSNIYCEVPYCSASSRYFVYARVNPQLKNNRTELMVVELGTWKQHRLDVAVSTAGLAISPKGVLYYLKRSGSEELELLRADLDEGTPQVVYRRKQEQWVRSLGTVSPDENYYAGGVVTGSRWDEFGIVLVDLKTGNEQIIDRDPFILNPHPQFDPGPRRQLMIQHNRGGKYTPEGKLERLVGEEGATLYVLSAPEGKRTELQEGKPYTTACTGHEAWIGQTGQMLLTVSASGQFASERGNLLAVSPGSAARVVAKGYRFNHVGVSRCGKLFSCDDWQPPYNVVIGSIATWRTAVVCASHTKPDRDQSTHPHPYLTPDLKWVIFNSNRSGRSHVYAASVPPQMIEQLQQPSS